MSDQVYDIKELDGCRVVALGGGQWLVGRGTFLGRPCITFIPSPDGPHPVGTPFMEDQVLRTSPGKLPEGTIILLIGKPDAWKIVASAMAWIGRRLFKGK